MPQINGKEIGPIGYGLMGNVKVPILLSYQLTIRYLRPNMAAGASPRGTSFQSYESIPRQWLQLLEWGRVLRHTSQQFSDFDGEVFY